MKKSNFKVSFSGKGTLIALSQILESAVRSADLSDDQLVIACSFYLRVEEAVNHFLKLENSDKFFEEDVKNAEDDMSNL